MILSDICQYVSEKISVSSLDENTYISTENMLPNKSGITVATNLPATEYTPKYNTDDILISNIRPYFKKIYKAQKQGGCSADVLVLRAKQGIIPSFLYYVLSDDAFFEYATATSKGTKMPRGDKIAIMKYKVPNVSPEIQQKIASILSVLDHKIELNQRQNNNLEQQAQALYVNNIELYKERNIKVEDIVITANTGADAIQKAPIVDYDTGVKCVRVGDMSNKRSYSDWGYAKVTDDVFSQYQLKKDDIIVTRTASLGLNTIISKNLDAVYNNGLIRLTINKDVIVPLLVYRQFQTDDFKNYISKIEGETSVRPNMKINYLLQYSFAVMNKEKQKELIKVLEPLWNKQEQLIEENTRLAAIRDALLPKLMSGEIDVSNVDISALTSTDKLSFTEE